MSDLKPDLLTAIIQAIKSLFGTITTPPPVPALPDVIDDATPFTLSPDEMVACVIAAGCAPATAAVVALAFTKAFIRVNVTGRLSIAHVLAHCAHESADFTKQREDMTYRTATRIREVFGGNRGIALLPYAAVDALVRNPEALANIVYADSNRAAPYRLGNTMEGDGFKFRAWGWCGLTGRDAITAFARHVGMLIDDVLARGDADINARAALWFATVYKKGFIDAAQADNLLATRRIWNGGSIGLDDCRNKLNAIKRVMQL